MFAIVRTGGKQYRVAAGDKITVEKLAGEVGDQVELSDVLLAGEGADVKAGGVAVAAEIIAQGRGDKIIVFKKKRRHNYRRKAGHRQYHTLLRIVSIGGAAKAPAKAKAAPADAETPTKAAPKKAAPKKAADA